VGVEGVNAAAGLIEALLKVEQSGAEVVLLVRGGGSFEDLMPFNDEELARTIASLSIPVITGIGHEPDTSIADMVADVRASTPTAAALAVVPAEAPKELLLSQRSALCRAILRRLEKEKMDLAHLKKRPLFLDSNMLFANEAQTLDFFEQRLSRAIPQNLASNKVSLERLKAHLVLSAKTLLSGPQNSLSLKASRLNDLSPLTILSRGYAFAKDEKGTIVKSIDHVFKGQKISVSISDGDLDCTVNACTKVERISIKERIRNDQ
jgi:exodeoxyribonuclease VII large subunit